MLKPPLEVSATAAPQGFRQALTDWFACHGRDYPWRRTRDPYAILVSEVMLQQTQIATVLNRGFFAGFLLAFPDLHSLAEADDERLLKAWEGLGYYRRARMLRETARAVIGNHSGMFPRDLVELQKLPGIGRYTAGALRAFAFDLPAAVVDGNVARVLARIMDFKGAVDDASGLKQIWEWAEMLADPDRPRAFNSALMELGQTICRPSNPNCLACPVVRYCATREPALLPVKRPRVAVTEVDEHAIWLRDESGRILLHCEQGRRREGLWKLPTREAAEVAGLPVIAQQLYTITRYRVGLKVHHGGAPAAAETWIEVNDLERLPMPSPFRRVISRLLADS